MKKSDIVNVFDMISPDEIQKRRMLNYIICNEGKGAVMKTAVHNFETAVANLKAVATLRIGAVLKRHLKLAVCLASIVMVVAISSVTARAYYTPYSYVSLDVNPSIEFSINRFNRVISFKAVNDAGEAILETLNLKGKDIKIAIEITLKQIASAGYIPEKESENIIIVTSSKNEQKSTELATNLKNDAQKTIEEENLTAVIETESVGLERVEEAKELGVTPGKLNLVQKLQESAPDIVIDIDIWLDRSVKEIQEEIKKNLNAAKEKAIQNGNTTQDGDTSQNDNGIQQNSSNKIDETVQIVEIEEIEDGNTGAPADSSSKKDTSSDKKNDKKNDKDDGKSDNDNKDNNNGRNKDDDEDDKDNKSYWESFYNSDYLKNMNNGSYFNNNHYGNNFNSNIFNRNNYNWNNDNKQDNKKTK